MGRLNESSARKGEPSGSERIKADRTAEQPLKGRTKPEGSGAETSADRNPAGRHRLPGGKCRSMAWESPNGVLRWQERHRMCVSTSRKGDRMGCPFINSNAEQRPGLPNQEIKDQGLVAGCGLLIVPSDYPSASRDPPRLSLIICRSPFHSSFFILPTAIGTPSCLFFSGQFHGSSRLSQRWVSSGCS